jgi:hypothetical protein
MFQCFGIGVAPVDYYSVPSTGKDRLGIDHPEDADEGYMEEEGERVRILLELRGVRGSLVAAARRRIHEFFVLWKKRRTSQNESRIRTVIVRGDADADQDTEPSEFSEPTDARDNDLDKL